VILWDAWALAKERTLPIRCPVSLSWFADGTILVTGDAPGAAQGRPPCLRLWDAVRGRSLGAWEGFDEGHFAADGRALLTSSSGRVVLWDVQRVPQE
jgi:hypothetical protein